MAPSLPTHGPIPPAEALRPSGADLQQARLTVLRQLEASLGITQKALLAHDLPGLEQATSEQVRLRCALEILRAPGGAQISTADPTSADLRAAGMRVLHLGRVQAALLDRAQRSLRIISNLRAGTRASYGPPPGSTGAVAGPWPAK